MRAIINNIYGWCDRSGTEGAMRSPIGTRVLSGERSPPDEDAPHNEGDPIGHIKDETEY